VPLRDKHGNIVKWYGSSIDIEDRKRAEMESRLLIDAIPQQIWSGPPDGTIDYCSDRWRSETGLSLDDLRGDGWQAMLHPDDRERVLKAWHDSVQHGTPYEQEERHRRSDGRFRWYLSRGIPLRDAEGRIVRWYGTNTDIEGRKQAEGTLRRLSGQLLQAQDEERRRIARDLHDSTGQKLTALQMTLGSLKDPIAKLDPKSRKAFRECLALAKQSARELRSLTHLLHPPMLEQFGLADTLRWFVREFGRRSGIAVSLKVPSQIGHLPRDLATTLFRIVQEALRNVQQHSGSKKVKVSLVLNSKQVVLEVRDFGHGIVIPSAAKRPQGVPSLGIGITGMRERVEQVGGELQVSSSGKGTVLRAVLPVGRRAA
jgi:PAS domain S-box-containing protein